MASTSAPVDQLAVLKRAVRSRRPRPASAPAPERPVARVVVDLALAHLDRPFDYAVTEALHESAVPGCRVKVRFAGRDVDGFVVERSQSTEHVGELTPLRRVVSPEPVLSPAVLALARATADRYAGTLSDVLRLAVPPRHARVEAEAERPKQPPLAVAPGDLARTWRTETGGEAFVTRLSRGESPRAVWSTPPGARWPAQVAAAVAATLASGRGSVVCLPDTRDVAEVASALTALLGPDSHVVLTADLGPAARYRAFLALSRGTVSVVVGTRSAAFAPVRDLGLVAIWDDGDDLYDEPRSPYPHTREVLLLRAHQEGTALLVAGISRSVEAQALVESGWAAALTAPRDHVRAAAPQVHVAGESDTERERDPAAAAARMPKRVFEVVRHALASGPVLVHVPRSGYLPTLACDRCRSPARCARCTGPLGRPRRGVPASCRWCGAASEAWSCPTCGGRGLRSPVVGSLRTAEEWGRSFPLTTVVSSGGEYVVAEVDDRPAIVVATPGAEPRAQSGYLAAVLLDTWLTLSRPELRAGEEALRRWLNIAALVRPADRGGRVVAVGDPTAAALQALVRFDPEGFAARELAERRSAGLPPATRLATVVGTPDDVTQALGSLDLPAYAEVLGPTELPDGQARLVIRTARRRGAGMTKALHRLQAARSSRKQPPLQVRVDPGDFG
jgi:primosomal protein N' (replication factor Y) (superfamily II helicase)